MKKSIALFVFFVGQFLGINKIADYAASSPPRKLGLVIKMLILGICLLTGKIEKLYAQAPDIDYIAPTNGHFEVCGSQTTNQFFLFSDVGIPGPAFFTIKIQLSKNGTLLPNNTNLIPLPPYPACLDGGTPQTVSPINLICNDPNSCSPGFSFSYNAATGLYELYMPAGLLAHCNLEFSFMLAV